MGSSDMLRSFKELKVWQTSCFRKMLAAMLLAGWLVTACGAEKPHSDHAKGPVEIQQIQMDGISIPVFQSAGEQYHYAKSLSGRPLEKAAALKVLTRRFPEDRTKTGHARLELAYLKLGSDFRLAKTSDCRAALREYEKIVREYEGLSSICVKARWYMAWIYTDLLGDKEKGLRVYTFLAQHYPNESYSRVSPVPWLELVFPDNGEKPYSADDRAINTWASLALLEIIRNTDENRQKREAFDQLWSRYRQSLTTGYALREMLYSGEDSERMAGYVREYVTFSTVNPELTKDLQSLLGASS